jgi:hypothetical protein
VAAFTIGAEEPRGNRPRRKKKPALEIAADPIMARQKNFNT